MISPHHHRCDERTIDYSTIAEGVLRCTACGRKWTQGASGWVPFPFTKHPPRG